MGAARVSVIIPTYNRAYSLGAAIGSLQRQTYPDWEALVIDDGSTDDTAAVIMRMQAEDSRIKRHYQPNRGVSAARNAGLRPRVVHPAALQVQGGQGQVAAV